MGCAKRSGFISCVFLRAAISIWNCEIWTEWDSESELIGSPSKCQMRNVECWNGVDFHTTQREIRNQQRVLSLTDGQPPLNLSLSLCLCICLCCGRKGEEGTGRGGFRCRWANQFWLQLLLHSAVNVCRWQTKLKCPVRLVLPSIVTFHLSVLCPNCVCVCLCVCYS